MCVRKIAIRSPKTQQIIQVPCGNCSECLENRRSQWSFRLQQELKLSHSAYFVTLTYNIENLPENEELNKKDCQNFLKKLRRANAKYTTNKVRYYLGGEYGDKNNRPHYHMIVFNLSKRLLSTIKDYEDSETGELRVRCIELEWLWKNGNVFIGKVEPASIHYTTGYIMQKQSTEKKVKPFALMSRKPPIGIGYLEDNQVKRWHKENPYIVFEGGFKKTMPRIYGSRLYNDSEKVQNKLSNLKEKHEADKKLQKKYKSEFRERLEASKEVKQRVLKQKIKSKHKN